MSLVAELQRRNVFRVAAAYLVAGWLLTEVLTTILPTLGAPEWTSRLVILLFALGFVPTVILAWAFEWTSEGIRRDHGPTDEQYPPHKAFNYSVIATVVLLVVVIAVLGSRPAGDSTDTFVEPVSTASVAVLPFVNMSNDDDNEYFSDGLTETLLHMLAQIPDLQVAARTSSFAFKGQNKDISEIAEALRVAHVLEGSVQKSGNQIRVFAQLIRASDGFHVWSQNYDRTVDDIFEIQDEIARDVGNELSETLLGEAPVKTVALVGTENPDAYDLYLQASKARATFSYRGLLESENLLKGALAIDPDFLDAKAELAGNYLQQYETGLMSREDAIAQMEALVEQVLTAQPDHARGQAIHVFADALKLAEDGDVQAIPNAIVILEELVQLHPDEYQVRHMLSRLLRSVNRNERALEIQLAALEQDPYNFRILYEISSLQMALKQWDAARVSLQRSLDIEPMQPNAYTSLAKVSLHQGDGADYLQQLLFAMSVDPQDHELPGSVAVFLYQLGLVEEGDDFRDRVVAIAPTSEIVYKLEILRAIALGDESASVASARRAIVDNISDRLSVYAFAVQHLLDVAARNGTVDEEYAWLEAQVPGMLDVDNVPGDHKYRHAQIAALDAWYTILPQDELLRRMGKLAEFAEAYGVDPFESPKSRMRYEALQGNPEQAIRIALDEVLPQPVTRNLRWKDLADKPVYADVVADERVRAGLARWDEDWLALRSKVSTYLEDLSVASVAASVRR